MNKYLKLTLIFAAIIGVIVVLRFIVDDVETDSVNPPSASKYSELYDEIRSKWREQKQWDEDLYKTCMDTINKYYTYDFIGKKEYNLLFELVNANAVVTIGEFFDSEMKKAECDDSKIEKNKAGLDTISAYKNPRNKGYDFSKDTRVANADTMYKQYKKIIEFCDKDFNVNAELEGKCEWVPFSYYNDEWNSQKDSLENGKYYTSHFSKINKVKDAWSSYDSIVQQSKKEYYNDLAEKIKHYFDQRYANEKLEYNQKVLIDSGVEINNSNDELVKQYYKVKTAYESIKNSYNIIKNNINNLDNEIKNDCREGSDKYRRKVREKADYVEDVKKGNQYNNEIKAEIDSLTRKLENNKKKYEELKKSIEDDGAHKDKLENYDKELREVNTKFTKESEFDTLNRYCEDKGKRITTMLNDLPMVKKDKNDSYISDLKEYSVELKSIIEYIENL